MCSLGRHGWNAIVAALRLIGALVLSVLIFTAGGWSMKLWLLHRQHPEESWPQLMVMHASDWWTRDLDWALWGTVALAGAVATVTAVAVLIAALQWSGAAAWRLVRGHELPSWQGPLWQFWVAGGGLCWWLCCCGCCGCCRPGGPPPPRGATRRRQYDALVPDAGQT